MRVYFRSLKENFIRLVWQKASFQRIHIVGCARSGTTMFQYALLAFENSLVENQETSPNYPGFLKKLGLATHKNSFYITKRNYDWFEDARVADLVRLTRVYDMGIVLCVRNPNAVMVSVHAGSGSNETSYLEQERWYQSVIAGEQIMQQLAGYKKLLVVRYEDIVANPAQVESGLNRAFGLHKLPNMGDISQIKSNTEKRNYKIDKGQLDAMHKLRDASPDSLQRTYPAIKLESDEILQKYLEFCSTYNYEPNLVE